MDADMVAMFPNGIRALMIDDDTKFLKSATTLLSVLNFDVVRCSSVAHALKSLTNGDLTGFDVILVHAANAAACGFDFRAIVETDLLIPVIYFLEEDHEATGDEADELLRTLQAAGSYIIKKPLDVDEVRTRLWTVIAFRKCDLETKASRGGEAGLGVGGEDDEDRVHFKVVIKGRGRKRKGSSSKQGGSSGTTVTAGSHPAAKGKEKDRVGSQQQPAQQNDGRAKKAQKNGGGEAFNLPQPNTTVTNNGQQQHVRQHQPKPSDLFMRSVLRMLALPPNNPEFFTNATVPSYNPQFLLDAAGPSSNAAAFAGSSNIAVPAAPLPLCSVAPPSLHPVARQQQHHLAHNNAIFGNITPSSAAAPTMAATAAYEPQFSQGISNKQQQQEEEEDVHPLLMFGPFPYQGPTQPPPAVEQGILAPPAAAGDPFTGGMARGGMTGGAPAAAATEPVAYGNEVNLPFLQPPNLGVEQDGNKELPGTVGMDMYARMARALDDVAMLDLLLSHSFNNYSAGSSFVVPEDQVLGMVPNLNGLATMEGGALGSSNVVSLTVSHQDLSDNGDQQQQDVPPQLMFPYQGSPQPVAKQDMVVAPAAAGDLFTGGMAAGGDTTGGASSAAAATEAGAYGNDVSLSFLQPPNIIAEQDGDDELAGMMAMDLSYASMADPHPPMLPQHTSDDASGKAKILDLLCSDDCNAGSSLVAPDDQAPGMASNSNELTALAGRAFGSSDDTAFMAPHQDLSEGPSGDHQLALDNDINGSLMGSQDQDTGAAMEVDDAAGLKDAMLPSDQYEGDTSFPLEALLGDLHGPMFEFDDADLDAMPDGGAGGSLVAGEEGGSENALENLAGLDIPHDVMQLSDFPFPQPKNKNVVRE